jgi:O-antigen/teichoic acid export membrane protein
LSSNGGALGSARFAAMRELLRDFAFFGAGGLAFAAANLLFARVFSVEQYALVTLLVALATFGFAFGPIGLDGVALREGRAVPTPLIVAITVTAGLALGCASAAGYGLSLALATALCAAIAAGAVVFVAAADLRHARRFGAAMALSQSPNVVLLVAAAVCIALGAYSAAVAFAVLTAGLLLVAAVALVVRRSAKAHTIPVRLVPWREALALAGASAATMLLIQLERIALPHLLPLADLALATFAGSLFRILQITVGFSLVTKFRAARTAHDRRLLVARSAGPAMTIVIVGSLAIFALAPFVEHVLLADKYDLSSELLVAAVVSGASKIVDSFVKTIGDALATARELMSINALGFAAVVIAAAGAVFGARFGLVGVIYGVAAGWQFRAAAASLIVARYLRESTTVPAATT